MFTWNLQFVSKKRLEDTLYQFLVSEEEEKSVLIRIHTAIHTAEEAVDLAAFIKKPFRTRRSWAPAPPRLSARES